MLGVFINHFVSWVRSQRRYWPLFLLKSFTLVFGLLGSLALLNFLVNEAQHDKKIVDDVFRVIPEYVENGQLKRSVFVPGALGDLIRSDVEGINDVASFIRPNSDVIIANGSQFFKQPGAFFVDSNFVSVFRCQVLFRFAGNILQGKSRAVLTRSTAERIFGTLDVSDKSLDVIVNGSSEQYGIDAIIEDPEMNDHVQYSILLSGSNHFLWERELISIRYTYVQIKPGEERRTIEEILNQLIKVRFDEHPWLSKMTARLVDVDQAYFDNEIIYDQTLKGNRNLVEIVTVLFVLVVLMTTYNHLVLSSAQMLSGLTGRSVRRIFGASDLSITASAIIIETIYAAVCGAIALLFYELVLTEVISRHVGIGLVGIVEGGVVGYFLVLVLFIAWLSVILPLSLLGISKRVSIINTQNRPFPASLTPRKLLFLFSGQIMLAGVMAVCALGIRKQVEFMTASLEQKSDIVLLSFSESIPRNLWVEFTDALRNLSGVKEVGGTHFGLADGFDRGPVSYAGKDLECYFSFTDEGLIGAAGFSIISGRNFVGLTDSTSIIVNSAAMDALGFEAEDIGQSLLFNEKPLRIVGVVKDFHFQSFDRPILPLMFVFQGGFKRILVVSLFDTSGISQVKDLWKRLMIPAPFEFQYLDEKMKSLARDEVQLDIISQVFALFLLTTACLGLVNILVYIIRMGRRETMIRVVLGAGYSDLLKRDVTNFLRLIIPSVFMAILIGYFVLGNWLKSFAYKSQLTILEMTAVNVCIIFFLVAIVSIASLLNLKTNTVKALYNI